MACLAPGRCAPASPAQLPHACTTWRSDRRPPAELPRPRGSCALILPATAPVPCTATLDPSGAAGQTAACRWWRRCARASAPGSPHWPDVPPAKPCPRSRLEIPLPRRSVPRRWPASRCRTRSFARPLAQQALFQGGAFLWIAPLVVGNAIRRGGLALDRPVGTAILTHRPDVAILVFQ